MPRPASIFSWLFILSLIACAPPEGQYFPLVDGTWRHYEIVTKILDETKKQRRISGVVERANTDRGAIFILRQAPDVDAYLQRNSDGIFSIGTRDRHTLTETWAQSPQKIIPLTPKIGDTWTVESRLGLIESRTFARQDRLRNRTIPVQLRYEVVAVGETVTVPAGSFDNCLLLQASGNVVVRTDRGNASAEVRVSRQDWYAPGVGLVKSLRVEESESPFLKPGSCEQTLIALGLD